MNPLWDEERGVTITQEAEIVSQRIVVYLMPVALDKGTNQQ